MKELKCPKCGNVFKVDEADYAFIVSQVKTAEFEAEINHRLSELHERHKAEQELATAKTEQTFQSQLSKKELGLGAKDAEIERLKSETEQLYAENEELHQQLDDKDMKLNELGKFSVNVAKKSSQEVVEKAMRIYLNTSKRKTLSKREAAKTVLLELVTSAKLELPEDLMDQLNHFDDENPEPQIVIDKAGDVIADGGVKNVKNGTDD